MLNRALLPTLAVTLFVSACGGNHDAPRKALLGATLIDGTGAPAIPSSVVLIDGAAISAAGPQSAVPVPGDFEKVNVAGKFIVPGLIDVSVELPSDPAKLALASKAFLAAGITSIGSEQSAPGSALRVFPSLNRQAGIADLVIASHGSRPEATFAKIDRMAKAEIPALQIIQAATQNGADWLRQTGLGTIAPGKQADLLVLNADPAASVRNLHQIYRAMLGGHWLAEK